MNSKILNSIANAIDNREEPRKRSEHGQIVLQDLIKCTQNVQSRFGGKSELATEDDLRITHLCERWEKVLSHGIRTNLSGSSLQSLVTAGINFTFNIINVGNSLWSYTCLHLTKHEKERFKILSNINTPLGYFRAFLRASLNERSLERYLQSWLSHGLLLEYYDEGALVRDAETSQLLPKLASGLSSVLFALSIDRPELNESQQNNQVSKPEHVIPLPMPVRTANPKRKPLRQVISFDKEQKSQTQEKAPPAPTADLDESMWRSAPATCLNSPDPIAPRMASNSEPTSSECRGSLRYFFPDGVKNIDGPSQIFTKLSERAKEIFSSSNSIDVNSVLRDDLSERSINNLKISESDSEEVAGSIDGSTSCLELCFTEDEGVSDDKSLHTVLEFREKEYINLQIKCSQIEIASKEKIKKLEHVVLDLSKENERLKEQLRHYMSAVEMGKAMRNNDNDETEEVSQYERKLVQVAEMHAELMEFNQHLQQKLQDMENLAGLEVMDLPESNVKAYIPSAFLCGTKSRSYHVYQIFLKLGSEEWNVYHRYAKFHELHCQLRKLHPDIASYKFPPKKTLRKRAARVVECRRLALQAYLRHVLLVLPELRDCTSRAQLITLLPFFGSSSTARESALNNDHAAIDSSSIYNAL